MRPTLLLSIMVALAAASPARAQEPWFLGGGVGFGFGDREFVDLSVMTGYHWSERVATGVRASWRQSDVELAGDDLETNDYGGSVFGQWFLTSYFFLGAEYELLSYEYLRFDLTSDRDTFSSVLAGGGVAVPIGRKSAFYSSVLYNFSYDSDETSPYDSPVVLRGGIAVRF
jgi:hypothetical protein